MTDWAAKRFWTDATAVPEAAGWGVRLDQRPLRTPLKAPLVVPTRAFAEAVAAEWAEAPPVIDPRAMRATRLANAAIDKVAAQHAEVVDHVAAYGATDLLCYRAEGPETLVERQRAAWDPVLAWAHEALGAEMRVATGIMPVEQDPNALARLREPVEAADPFRLAAIHDLVALTGSLVLGLSVTHGWLAPEEAWSLSRLDEDFQAEEWGADEEAAEMAALRRGAFLDAARFFILLVPHTKD